MKKERVSPAVIRRLPRYYRHLEELHQSGVVRISSGALADALGLTASQIRQDLSCFGEFGQQGYGYNIERLRDEVAEILGMNRGHTAVILGAGNLGRALIRNFQFSFNGFRLLAAFDPNPALIGSTLGGIPVYPAEAMEGYIREHQVDVAVLTVPAAVAGEITQRLVDCGVKGIWNFTNVELPICPEEKVKVENVHFADSLLNLSYMISEEQL